MLITHICKICSISFQTRKRDQIFCSRNCARKQRMLTAAKRSCLQCGKSIKVGASSLRKHCSFICRDKTNTKWAVKPCLRCGQGFKPKSQKSTYCSKSCAQIKYKDKTCLNCGKNFKPRNEKSKFCSRNCGSEYFVNLRKKEKRDEGICIYCKNNGCYRCMAFFFAKPKADNIGKRVTVANLRAQKFALAGRITAEDWQGKLTFFGNKCYLCKINLDGLVVHLDHRKPLTKGGTNWIANIAPACAKCNIRKGNKPENEFRRSNLLPIS